MKAYIKIWLGAFAAVNGMMLLISLIIMRRLNISNLPFVKLETGALVISLFIALSAFIFQLKRGNIILKIAGGLLAVLPSVFVLRNIFGILVFRYSFVIYLAFAVCALIYGLVVFITAHKTKKEENELNKLIKKDNQNNKEI